MNIKQLINIGAEEHAEYPDKQYHDILLSAEVRRAFKAGADFLKSKWEPLIREYCECVADSEKDKRKRLQEFNL